MKLGTARTIIAETQIFAMLDDGWRALDRNGMSWENYREMIEHYLLEKENEDERKHARENSYTE